MMFTGERVGPDGMGNGQIWEGLFESVLNFSS